MNIVWFGALLLRALLLEELRTKALAWPENVQNIKF